MKCNVLKRLIITIDAFFFWGGSRHPFLLVSSTITKAANGNRSASVASPRNRTGHSFFLRLRLRELKLQKERKRGIVDALSPRGSPSGSKLGQRREATLGRMGRKQSFTMKNQAANWINAKYAHHLQTNALSKDRPSC